LNQSCDDYEIIVVDDGSTDQATVTVLDRLDHSGVKLVRTSNQGLAAARNNGITAACAEFILPLDADDRIGPAYLERAGAILGSHPEVG
ncbi:glycosyltransferase family 2 protein, partial [Klebsiella pneumoniae]|nr:glycosyltransferase family 2 protein [Klebsiella pneumoniae]